MFQHVKDVKHGQGQISSQKYHRLVSNMNTIDERRTIKRDVVNYRILKQR